jgi:hypothetical protein
MRKITFEPVLGNVVASREIREDDRCRCYPVTVTPLLTYADHLQPPLPTLDRLTRHRFHFGSVAD